MVGSKWSEDTTIKFVNQYVSHECLWNTKHPLYKNKLTRLKAYMDIANTMNLPNFGEKETIVKIKNIRSTYCQELKKIKESKISGAGENVYVPNMKWFSILNSIRKTQDDFETAQSESTENSIGGTSFQDDSCNGVTNSKPNNEESVDNTVIETEQPRSLKKRRLQELSSLLTQVKEVCAMNNALPPEEHEFDIFGRSVAAQLKMLPLDKALKAQHYIQSYLTGLRLKEYPSSPSSTYNTSPYSPQYVVDVKSEQMSP